MNLLEKFNAVKEALSAADIPLDAVLEKPRYLADLIEDREALADVQLQDKHDALQKDFAALQDELEESNLALSRLQGDLQALGIDLESDTPLAEQVDTLADARASLKVTQACASIGINEPLDDAEEGDIVPTSNALEVFQSIADPVERAQYWQAHQDEIYQSN